MDKILKNQRRKPVQARSIMKYNEILDASARVLQSHGYQNVTMQEISLESGHPYSTIYQYFANKEDIYMSWLERFIDTSLYGLSSLMTSRKEADIEVYVDESVKLALEETAKQQNTLSALFGNMPMITSRLVELMEMRTLTWLEEAFGLKMNKDPNSPVQKLLTTVRAGNGYWLQLTLNAERAIDIETESRNFSALVKALLLMK